MSFYFIFFSFLSLSFASESVGLLTHELYTATTVLFVLLTGLIAKPNKGDAVNQSDHKTSLLIGLLNSLTGLVLIVLPSPWRFFSLALWFWGLSRWTKKEYEKESQAFALASLIIGLFQYAVTHSLLAWYGLQETSQIISSGARLLTSFTQTLGPTFSGLELVITLIVTIFCLWRCSLARRWEPLVATCLALTIFYGVYLSLWTILPFAASSEVTWPFITKSLKKVHQLFYPNQMTGLLVMLLVIPLAWYQWVLKNETSRIASKTKTSSYWFPLGLALLAMCLLTNFQPLTPGDSKQVALYEKGFINWISPSRHMYGRGSVGMFGNLPQYFAAMGWGSKKISTLSAEALEDSDILVIINQNESFPEETQEVIHSFVREGGGLLILGDHTWHKGGKLVLNEPLEPSQIRFVFDSADFLVGGWLHSYRHWPHPMTTDLDDRYNEAGSVVGASLDISYPAIPLALGRHGYSDPGEYEATDRGYLGNLDFDPGEPLGDLVLAAAQNVGQGRVVVFGDTSPLANGFMINTWPWMTRVFHWLADKKGQATISLWRDLSGLIFLCLAAFLMIKKSSFGPGHFSQPLFSLIFIVMGLSFQSLKSVDAKDFFTMGTENKEAPPLALMDQSHFGQYSLEGRGDDSVGNIGINLMRSDYFVLNMKHFEEELLKASQLFVSISPGQSYSREEVDILMDYMNQGGTFILAVGWEEREPCQLFLEKAGLTIEHKPLGRNYAVVEGLETQPLFWKAWPTRGGEPLAKIWGEPVAVRKAFGQGQLILIADSHFLRHKNFEADEKPQMPNIKFFEFLIDSIKDR